MGRPKKETKEKMSESNNEKSEIKNDLKLLKKKKKEVKEETIEEVVESKPKYRQCYKTFPVHFIDDSELISLIKENSKLTTEDIYYGFGWDNVSDQVFCADIKKGHQDIDSRDLGTESDFLEYFVCKGILPEGNYLILIT